MNILSMFNKDKELSKCKETVKELEEVIVNNRYLPSTRPNLEKAVITIIGYSKLTQDTLLFKLIQVLENNQLEVMKKHINGVLKIRRNQDNGL